MKYLISRNLAKQYSLSKDAIAKVCLNATQYQLFIILTVRVFR